MGAPRGAGFGGEDPPGGGGAAAADATSNEYLPDAVAAVAAAAALASVVATAAAAADAAAATASSASVGSAGRPTANVAAPVPCDDAPPPVWRTPPPGVPPMPRLRVRKRRRCCGRCCMESSAWALMVWWLSTNRSVSSRISACGSERCAISAVL